MMSEAESTSPGVTTKSIIQQAADAGRLMGREEGRVEVAQYLFKAVDAISTPDFKTLCAWIAERNASDARESGGER